MIHAADGAEPTAPGFHYGWLVVGAAFMVFALVYGCILYSFTVFVNPVAKALMVTPAQVQLAFALTNVGTGVLGIWAGRLLVRYSKRNCIVGGLAILALGFLGLSVVSSLWQFILLYAVVVAFGAALAAPMGASTIVANWFSRSRGRALTVAMMGTSFGQILIPKLATVIIDGHGWRAAYQVFSVMIVVIGIPAVLFVMNDRPEEKGLKPFGASSSNSSAIAPSEFPDLLSLGQVLRRVDFWAIGISYVLCVVVYLALVASIVPYARLTFGVGALQASNLVVTMGVGSILGKIAFSIWTDKIGLRSTFWIAIVLNGIALIALIVVPNYESLYLASFCCGSAAGGILPVWPGFVAFRFGRRSLAQVMGLMSPIVVGLQGFGAPLAAQLHYRLAFELFLVFLIVAVLTSYSLNKAASVP